VKSNEKTAGQLGAHSANGKRSRVDTLGRRLSQRSTRLARLGDCSRASLDLGCMDCPEYVLLDRGIDNPLFPLHPGNGLVLLNALPFHLAAVPEIGAAGVAHLTRAVAPMQFVLLSTAQWTLLGVLLQVALRARRLSRAWRALASIIEAHQTPPAHGSASVSRPAHCHRDRDSRERIDSATRATL